MRFTDQLHRTIEVDFPPQKIISLVTSQTELLFDLGLEDQLTGVTKFCVHPAHIRKTKQIIGGTKDLRIEDIKKLNPGLIIANKEENEQTQIEELSQYFPVWISDIKTFDDALEMINLIGELTNTSVRSSHMINNILSAKASFNTKPKYFETLYLIWKDPYMTIGGDTFISNMMQIAGFDNIFKKQTRYPEINNSELSTLNPELIFLSSEPYPFKEKHVTELQGISPNSKILLVDGEMFSWYGSRMTKSFLYFEGLHKIIIHL